MTDRELMQQALEALEWHLEKGAWGADIEGVAAALRERLAQPQRTHWEGCEDVHPECRKQEQEPVAYYYPDDKQAFCVWPDGKYPAEAIPLYTTPPRREWVGLTDDEIAVICGECAASAHRTDDISYARAIEAKLKEKNNG